MPDVLGVRVDNLKKKEILEKIEFFLSEENFHQIATVNPEFILAARKDGKFKNILNSCDLNIADGIGINLAFWKFGFQKLKERITGVDLMWKILKIANDRRLKIFLVANKDGLSNYEETSAAIKVAYPGIKIEGINLDKKISNFQFPISNKISNTKYDMLFCNFGAPYQEKFLHSLKRGNYGKIKLAVGVGGSFDFLTGRLRRAPLWVRKIGLEWLFRLVQQPKRVKRIFNAVIIFPIKVLINKK